MCVVQKEEVIMQYEKYCVFLFVFCDVYSSENSPLIQPKTVMQSRAETCFSVSYMIGCPAVCMLGSFLIAEACLYASPHACRNFPIPLKNDTDIDTLQSNMWAGPVIFVAAGAVVGSLCSAALWKFHKRCSTDKNMKIL
jgi:hypothetical protein